MGTESHNINSSKLDLMPTREIIRLMNHETRNSLVSVEKAAPEIGSLIADIIKSDVQRIIYAGAGTSGRLGVLDASECPPTFHTDPEEFIGLIAGGEEALKTAIEGAEDSAELGEKEMSDLNVTNGDCVIGIAASGNTPYVKGVLSEAAERGALTASISNNTGSEISALVKHPIEIDSGAEIISGSTRLKAGTTQKLVLNMISTIVNIRRGKVFGNYMVDVNPTNDKLEGRAVEMIKDIAGISGLEARTAYESSGKRVKTAVVSLLLNVTPDNAEAMMEEEPNIRKIIEG